MTVTSERLRTIRESRYMTRAELERACGPGRITERQIARIESGESETPRQNTLKVLAAGLRVEVGELTGELPFPDYVRSGSGPPEVGDTFSVGGKFRPELRLAFDLIRHRYGWEEQRVIALAPLMFVLLVERCIGWQKRRLADLNEQLERFGRQVPGRFEAIVDRDDALDALKDVPTGEDQPLPEHFPRTFGEYLRALAAELPAGAVEPMVTDRWSGPQGRICEAYLDRLTGGSHLARWALEYGDVRLDDIPEELRADEAKGERAEWLERRLSDGAKAMLRERSDRGLSVGPRSIGRWKAGEPGGEGEDGPAGS